MKCGAASKRRGKSSFPKQRDAKYRRWVWTENPCMLRGRFIYKPFSSHDRVWGWSDPANSWKHHCWGANTPAHVGDTQARGAPDFGVLVPLCQAAHRFYDNKRWLWQEVTEYTEADMASAASAYALKYVELGGVPVLSGKETA